DLGNQVSKQGSEGRRPGNHKPGRRTAVTGESGSGKSSFINTTGEAKVYAHPSVLTVQLWDLPGIGTPSFQPQDDLDAVGLYQYDFIIVTSEQFKECCVILPKCVEQVGKNFYFVCKKRLGLLYCIESDQNQL
uniref:IRG-type G domain-containing protein n=1 Tax=Scleropages formosus TaxID=113540 RepID=A0A8C9VLR5_SCLFO